MTRRRLPPLNPLRNFEAAARCGSFTRAAEELNVTPVAVSRQVGVLEDYFDKALFVRHANTIELTAAGAALLPNVTAALDLIDNGARRILAATADTPVVVCTYQAFAMQWLIPRLPRFRTAHPEIDLNLTTAATPDEFDNADADIVIKYGRESRPQQVGQPILPDIVVPVCSPALIAGPNTLPPLTNLVHHTLLRSRYRRLDWPNWLAVMGAPDLRPRHELTFKGAGLANQAAAQGIGVAIAQRLLVENELANGQLIMPFDTALRRAADIWMSGPRQRHDNPHVALVRDWIEREARDTVAGFGLQYTPSTVETAQALTLPSEARRPPVRP